MCCVYHPKELLILESGISSGRNNARHEKTIRNCRLCCCVSREQESKSNIQQKGKMHVCANVPCPENTMALRSNNSAVSQLLLYTHTPPPLGFLFIWPRSLMSLPIALPSRLPSSTPSLTVPLPGISSIADRNCPPSLDRSFRIAFYTFPPPLSS